MILSYKFKEQVAEDVLLAYQQGVLDIAAYNSALLETRSPSSQGVEGDDGVQADAYYNAIMENANDWMQTIVPHCRIIPETIVGYDFIFKDSMMILEQGLKALIVNPKDKDTRESMGALLKDMGEVMDSYVADIEGLISQINKYYSKVRININGFNSILESVEDQIEIDEKKKDELKKKVTDTINKLDRERQRLKNDKEMLENAWFIIASVLTLGIPLIAVGIDSIVARKEVETEEKLLDAYSEQLNDTERTLASLYGSQAVYEVLKADAEKMESSSGDILNIWKMFADTCKDFAEKVVDESQMFEEEHFREALDEIKIMTNSWNELAALAEPLSNIEYDITVTVEAAA